MADIHIKDSQGNTLYEGPVEGLWRNRIAQAEWEVQYQQHRRQQRPAPMGGGFESFWLRDQVVEERRWREVECTPERPCTMCREALRRRDLTQSGSTPLPTGYFENASVQPTPTEGAQSPFTPEYERGEVVGIDLPGDRNHGRDGPIWSVPVKPTDPYEVWFEDGIRPYPHDSLEDQEYRFDPKKMDALPEIRPSDWAPLNGQSPITAPKPAVEFGRYESALQRGLRKHPKPRR